MSETENTPVVSHAEALRVVMEQAARLLRSWAGDRQRATVKWTMQEQAGVDCAIQLEAALAIPSPDPEPVDLRGDWNAHMDAVREALDAKPAAAIPSPDLRALVEQWRDKAERHSKHGDSYRIGQGWGLEECADQLSALLGERR